MIIAESTERGVEQLWDRGGGRGEGVGHTQHRIRAVTAMISNQQQFLAATGKPGGESSNQGDQQAVSEEMDGGRRIKGVDQQKAYKSGGDNEAGQKSPATYQKRSGKGNDAQGRRQVRVLDGGRCATKGDRGQKRALPGKSCRNAWV
jgi:hypothetical protein